MKAKTLSICPEYSVLSIRDVNPPADLAAADDAQVRAGTEIAAATREVVFIFAAQSLLRVQLTVKAYSRPKGAGSDSQWAGTFRFDVDFPSGAVRFGDTFHRADSMDLPGGAGCYTVTVHHAGREAADQAVRQITGRADWTDAELDRHANIERYLVTLEPQIHPTSAR